jgi:cytidylate kinase
VGAGQAQFADLAVLRLWVEADEDLRRERTLEREGPAMETAMREWWPREARLFAADGTRDRADLVIDSTPRTDVDRESTLVVLEDRRR